MFKFIFMNALKYFQNFELKKGRQLLLALYYIVLLCKLPNSTQIRRNKFRQKYMQIAHSTVAENIVT